MTRNTFHLGVDGLLAFAMLGLIGTGLIMYFILPPGSGGLAVWGLTRHGWGDLHFWMSMAILAFVLVHLLLNWGWVCTVMLKTFSSKAVAPARWKRRVAGVVSLVVVAGLVTGFLWAAKLSVTTSAPGGGEGRHRREADNGIETGKAAQVRLFLDSKNQKF